MKTQTSQTESTTQREATARAAAAVGLSAKTFARIAVRKAVAEVEATGSLVVPPPSR